MVRCIRQEWPEGGEMWFSMLLGIETMSLDAWYSVGGLMLVRARDGIKCTLPNTIANTFISIWPNTTISTITVCETRCVFTRCRGSTKTVRNGVKSNKL